MQLSNINMEASVLGSILGNNELLYKVLDILNPECFQEGLHRDIYICIKQLLDLGEPISPFRVYNKFADRLGRTIRDIYQHYPVLQNL